MIRLKGRILKQYGDKIARAAFPNYKRDDMTRQSASSVIRQSTVQPDYNSLNTTNHPNGFPTQETTSIIEEETHSTTFYLRTSVLNNMKKDGSTVSKESVDRYLDFLS